MNRTIWVIGGGSGIGQAIALKEALEGNTVYITGRNERKLQQTYSKASNFKGKVIPRQCDASDEKAVRQIAKDIINEHLSIDSLVVSVGSAIAGNIEETTLTQWRNMNQNHLDSTFLTCKHAIPGLQAAQDGNILILGSIFGLTGKESRLSYCTVKGAMVNFVKAMALDYAGDVRINAICPGWVQTEMSMNLVNSSPNPEAALKERFGWHPMGRGGSPEEVAEMANFIMSSKASWMTGQNIALDGGYTAR